MTRPIGGVRGEAVGGEHALLVGGQLVGLVPDVMLAADELDEALPQRALPRVIGRGEELRHAEEVRRRQRARLVQRLLAECEQLAGPIVVGADAGRDVLQLREHPVFPDPVPEPVELEVERDVGVKGVVADGKPRPSGLVPDRPRPEDVIADPCPSARLRPSGAGARSRASARAFSAADPEQAGDHPVPRLLLSDEGVARTRLEVP